MILALDAGNSRIKWGLFDGCKWQSKGWTPLADIAVLRSDLGFIEAPARIIISNVAGQKIHRELEQLISLWPSESVWIKAQPVQCGVTNRYSTPTQLGSDRWAALIAAWRRCGRSCVVVNAGTALTIDALSDHGEFLGGLIVPGLTTMQSALAAKTAVLGVEPGHYFAFPTRTADAIFSGAITAMAGAVEKMVTTLGIRQGHPPDCLISGGDAGLLCGQLSVSATIVDNLVLDGLIEIAQG